MELEFKKISVALLESFPIEAEWKEELLFLKAFPIRTLFVFPYQIARAKHLLTDSEIEVGSIVDFPFGAGTFAKKAFEATQIYSDGAREVYISLMTEQLALISKENYQIFEQLSFGEQKLGLSIDSSYLSDEMKKILLNRMIELNVKSLLLGRKLTVKQAMYDLTKFKTAKNDSMFIHVNVEKPTLLEIEMLFQAGASSVVISNYREILPLLDKNS